MDDASKIAIKDYFPDFCIHTQKTKVDFSSLHEHISETINNTINRQSLRAIKKSIVNTLLRALRYESITDTDGRNYTESRLLRLLREEHSNIFKCDSLAVEVGTIHSIKGETHTATLYLETYYQGDYESNRLKEHFKGNRVKGNEGVRARESLKMAYVGLSRPTHLLCVAVHKDRIKDYISEISDDLWQKIEI
ncbi:MAG: hypothetical protein ABH952_04870 [Candidatus Omnitrophota bacterium]